MVGRVIIANVLQSPYYELSKNAIYRAGWLLGWSVSAGAAASYPGDGNTASAFL